MISWIQRYFQKHFRLVFAIILIAVAVPMVFIYSASGSAPAATTAGSSSSAPSSATTSATPNRLRRIFSDATWSIRLKAGYDALQGDQVQAIRAAAHRRPRPLPMSSTSPSRPPSRSRRSSPRCAPSRTSRASSTRPVITQFGDSLKTRTDPHRRRRQPHPPRRPPPRGARQARRRPGLRPAPRHQAAAQPRRLRLDRAGRHARLRRLQPRDQPDRGHPEEIP